jgi:putative transposase
MLVVESFLKSLIKLYGKHGWSLYPEVWNSSRLKHILHSPFEKSIIERAIDYVKDRIECFDNYYSCRKKVVNCNVNHVYQWLINLLNQMYIVDFLYNLSK